MRKSEDQEIIIKSSKAKVNENLIIDKRKLLIIKKESLIKFSEHQQEEKDIEESLD